MFQFTPYALFSLAGVLVSLWLAVAIWSRRPGKGIMPFVVMAIGLMIWTSGAFGRILVTTVFAKALFTQIMYLGITIVPPAWLFFILEYTGHHKYVTRRNIRLATIQPILVQIAVVTNPLHYAFWSEFSLETTNGLVVVNSIAGTLFWLHAVYSYILLLISCVVLLRTMFRSPELYRGQMVYLVIGVFAPWIANIVFLAGLSPLPLFVDLTPIAFVITVMCVAYSMYRFRLLDIVPIARDVIVDNMNDAMLVLDMTNRVVDVNPSAVKLLNKPVGEIVGQSMLDIIPHRRELIEQFANIENTVTELELELNGKTLFFELKISSIYNRQGETSARIVTLHDITKMKETNLALQVANEQAQEMTRLKSQFLATMSHELRTPLNAIIGYTDLQLAGMVGELTEAQQQYQERILSNAEHLLALINDVLDLSKIEAGRMEIIQKPFALRDWTNEIIKQNSVLAEAKGLEFISTIDDKLPETVIGDAGRLKQIVINLLSNAIKFTAEGHVKLTIEKQGDDKMAIIVDDTGIGISPHKQETIFDEFRQVDNSSTRQYSGTGLGLAIVRKLAIGMGGNVRVNSTVDKGSQFTVLVPLQTQETPVAPEIDVVA